MEREKIIQEFDFLIRDFCPSCTSDERYLEVLKAVRELLKEQEAMKECLKKKCVICPHCANCDVDENGLLKEQEESIPVSWLTEKLEGHPELPYAVTDGINNVLDLWEGR